MHRRHPPAGPLAAVPGKRHNILQLNICTVFQLLDENSIGGIETAQSRGRGKYHLILVPTQDTVLGGGVWGKNAASRPKHCVPDPTLHGKQPLLAGEIEKLKAGLLHPTSLLEFLPSFFFFF